MFNAIDVSKWQGTINWATVKKAGVSHAMIRAGYGNSVRQMDPQYKRNAAQCIALGIDWGVYWYSYATNVEHRPARRRAAACRPSRASSPPCRWPTTSSTSLASWLLTMPSGPL